VCRASAMKKLVGVAYRLQTIDQGVHYRPREYPVQRADDVAVQVRSVVGVDDSAGAGIPHTVTTCLGPIACYLA
jgi:hypothetical protein